MFRTQGCRPGPARASDRGWSLVELLSTLTILGVVSATAAPRLMDWATQARVSTLTHLEGTLQVAGTMARMRCAVEPGCDLQSGQAYVRYEGHPLRLVRGYPVGGHPEGIVQVIDSKGLVAVHQGERTVFHLPGGTPDRACRVVYQAPPRDGAMPVVQAQLEDC
ncbi:MAG: Tfp pilus assembly protein FimT/FimU [Aquabacterium sp.]